MAHCVNFGCLDGHGKNALFKLYQACWLVISTAGAVNLLWLWSYTPIQFLRWPGGVVVPSDLPKKKKQLMLNLKLCISFLDVASLYTQELRI